MILLHGCFLLFNSHLLRFQNQELLPLALDFSGALLVLLAKLGDILIAVTHDFSIVVKESSVLNETLLKLVIFFAQLRFSRLKLELLLSEVLLLRDERLLIFVHLAALIKQSSRR